MVKIDFDRPGIDCDWTASHKRSDVSPKESSPCGKRARLLNDVPEEELIVPINISSQDDPATQKPGVQEEDEEAGVVEDVAVQYCDQAAASCGLEEQEQQEEVDAMPLSEEPLEIDQKPQESQPVNQEPNATPTPAEQQLQVHESQLDSRSSFFSCFSWLTKLTQADPQPAHAPVHNQSADPTEAFESDLQQALLESASMHEAKEVSIAEGRARLQSVMDMYNAKPRAVEADGNCQFRALAQQLYGDESQHTSLRVRMLQQLKSAPECYSGFVHEPFEDYVNRMSRDGEWGDNVTLQAASDMLGADIHILTDQPGAEHLEVHPSTQNADPPQTPLWLAFLAEVHYDSVELL